MHVAVSISHTQNHRVDTNEVHLFIPVTCVMNARIKEFLIKELIILIDFEFVFDCLLCFGSRSKAHMLNSVIQLCVTFLQMKLYH